MTLSELLHIPIAGKNVLIIGFAAAGKTLIGKLLCCDQSHELIHTDDPLNAGYTGSQAIQSLLEDIEDYHRRMKPLIIEGVLGFQLLLHGYKPDLIIHVQVSRGQQRLIYLQERTTEKIKWLKGFNEMCLASYHQYLKNTPAEERPPIIDFLNEWNVIEKQD